DTILSIGFYLGLASLFVFSYAVFLVGSIVILFTYARLDFRKAMLLLFGFFLPHLALLNYYYFIDGLPQFTSFFYESNFSLHSVNLISWSSIFWLSAGLIVLFVLSMVMLNREAHFTRYQSQLLQVMLIWIAVAFISILFSNERTPHSFITFIPSSAYFISHYLMLIRRKWIAEMVLWAFIVSTGIISMTARFNQFTFVDYNKMWVVDSQYNAQVRNKKIAVLGNDLSLYQHNRMAAGFLNWELSQNIFNLDNYYGDIAIISDSFQSDLPDVIVDEKNNMDKIFSRVPSLKKMYRRNGNLYERIKSNVNLK
ncbi:MAG TPA: hypothetical protein DGG95_15770, partial [Cytophagales bacterium]|nr:hypothetical protein [Cytophagales bacterium]